MGCDQQASIWLLKSRRGYSGEAVETINKITGRNKRIMEAFLMRLCEHSLFLLRSPPDPSVLCFRCSTRGAGRASVPGPVQPGAPETDGGEPAPVRRALLQGGEPDPPQRCRQTFTGTQRRHPGPGPERPVRHRPGPTGD